MRLFDRHGRRSPVYVTGEGWMVNLNLEIALLRFCGPAALGGTKLR